MNDRRLWTSSEDSIIKSLVNQYGFKKWTLIASQMAKSFGSVTRTSKQIRQRWHNHLDPQINKCPWTDQQQKVIFQAHKLYGSKWKQIAKLLNARTDNSVKNHFYSTLRRSLRRINKYLGFKNSTNQMRILKPSILSQLIQDTQHNFDSKQLVAGIFEFASFKSSKNNKMQPMLEEQDKIKYQNAIEKLVQFNNIYQIDKKQTKCKQKRSKSTAINNQTKIKLVETSTDKDQIKEQIIIEKQEQIQHHHQNQSTLSGKQNSSWSVRSQNNGMLPELERPQKDYDFLQQIQPMVINSQNILWFQADEMKGIEDQMKQ